ncbi:MAG: hypothetical protein UV93_C0011G0004 [Candidatus Azambacteria bacterium GW2011_GWC2_43_27]|nr:MAG: hypothetical protein UV93_C0011G0004 [Candidatus Azambacteria bacterium GW2011_GWC2_43_27]
MRNHDKIDKKKLLRQMNHLTVPPRLEGVVKNTKMNPIRKKKKSINNMLYERLRHKH